MYINTVYPSSGAFACGVEIPAIPNWGVAIVDLPELTPPSKEKKLLPSVKGDSTESTPNRSERAFFLT